MGEDKQYTLEELEKKLTKKERTFCHEYIIDWNGSRAARKATYSENTCAEIACENLKKPHIKQYIEFIKNDIAKEAQISKLSLINELKLIAFSNLPQILLKYSDGGLEALSEDEQKVISEYYNDKREVGEEGSIVDSKTKFKLYDKRGAIQDLLKAMGWNEPEKIDHRSEDGSMSPKDVSSLPTEELIKRADAIKHINDKA